MGVASLGRGQVGHVGVEGVAAPSAVGLRVSEVGVARPPPKRGAQIMGGAGSGPLPRTRPAALPTRPMRAIPPAPAKLRRRGHLRDGDAQGGVRRVDCRTEHGTALRSKGRFPLILRLGPRSVILKLPTMVLKGRKTRFAPAQVAGSMSSQVSQIVIRPKSKEGRLMPF